MLGIYNNNGGQRRARAGGFDLDGNNANLDANDMNILEAAGAIHNNHQQSEDGSQESLNGLHNIHPKHKKFRR